MSKKELDHLYLSKNERLGIFLLMTLLFILILIPWSYQSNPVLVKYPGESICDRIENPYKSPIVNKSELYKNPEGTYKAKYFNPNNLSATDAKELKLPVKAFQSLQKYLSKGGTIKTKQQFSKIYGLDSNSFERLSPYLVLPDDKSGKYSIIHKSMIDMNAATKNELMSLPGIGEKLSDRIIKYRNLLGGFTRNSQLKEVYGLSDSTYNNCLPRMQIKTAINKININEATFETLAKHPYIGYKSAKILINYNKQHQQILGINEIHQMGVWDSSWIEKISPYLDFKIVH
jgi:DNA uptake protein ComE-like DNA-binding protein